MKIELPRLMDCPRCGTERRVTTTGNTVLPGEVVVEFTVGPCPLCDLLADERKPTDGD